MHNISRLKLDPVRLEAIQRHFGAYVDDGRLPGWQVQVSQHGDIVYRHRCGLRDMEQGLPMAEDSVFRIYSMTKPVTAVAAMMLYEQGRFDLMDPVARFLPAFAASRVLEGGTAADPVTRPANGPIRMLHLLNHTSGMTYGFHRQHLQDEIYRQAGYEWGAPPGYTLEQAVDDWARLPLRFDPGSAWNYSVSSDVLGRVIEVISGQDLAAFFRQHIFEPLGMPDTGFAAHGDMDERLAALYIPDDNGRAKRCDPLGDAAHEVPSFLSGGGGLLSTTADYHRFTQMLLQGGALDGQRLLGTRTIRRMTCNALPGGQDLEQLGIRLFSESSFEGHGFGLGFSVLLDPMAAHTLSSRGEYGWGGAASTAFWVDPAQEITVIFMTQLLPSSTHPIRPRLRQLVYSALLG